MIDIQQTPCKLACCKTPFLCATSYACSHHEADYERRLRQAEDAQLRYALTSGEPRL